MNIKVTILTLVSILNLFLILIMWPRKDKKAGKNLARISFICVALGTLIWLLSNLMWELIDNVKILYFSGVLGYISAIVISNGVFYFSSFFPSEFKLSRNRNIICIFFAILFFIMVTTPNVILKSVFIGQIRRLITFTPTLILLNAYFFFLMLFSFKNLLVKYIKSVGIERVQIRLVFLGIFLTFVFGSSFNLLAPLIFNNYQFVWLGPIFNLIMLVLFFYAITQRHLFDIRVVLTELLVLLIASILSIQALTAATFWAKVFGFGILVLFGVAGYFLIRSVIREIELRAELELLYGELKKLDDAKSEFISIASHQLRTPLTAVKGYVSMILENSYGKVPGEMDQPLKNVYASNERLIHLVNDILNISKIEAGKMEMDLENTSLEELILDIINELKVKADAKKLYLTYVKPAVPIPLVMIDKTKIRQVIMNLIDNSIKYMEKGGTIVRLLKTDSKVRIEISDTGIGLEKDDISKLFESFSRVKATSRTRAEGTGLGLYIARRYVEMHKGKIWVESMGKGTGSTFYIELPVK